MTSHSAHGRVDEPATSPDIPLPMFDDEATTTHFGALPESREDRRAREHAERVTVVICAAMGAVALIVVGLAMAGEGKNAMGVAMWALILGTGLAIGFRKRWTR